MRARKPAARLRQLPGRSRDAAVDPSLQRVSIPPRFLAPWRLHHLLIQFPVRKRGEPQTLELRSRAPVCDDLPLRLYWWACTRRHKADSDSMTAIPLSAVKKNRARSAREIGRAH